MLDLGALVKIDEGEGYIVSRTFTIPPEYDVVLFENKSLVRRRKNLIVIDPRPTEDKRIPKGIRDYLR